MSEIGDLGRLEAILDASGVSERIKAMLPIGVRPRQLSVRSLLLGILAALADERPAHLRRVHRALLWLPDPDKRRLGVTCAWKSGPHELTYRQVERTFGLVVAALSKQKPDGAPAQALSEVADALIEASVQVLGVPASSSYAIDWSDYESFARPPRKPCGKDEAQKDAEPAPGETDARQQAQHGQQQEARQDRHDQDRDEDGKGACADTEAAWGHRKVNHPAKSKTFFGYYPQAATIVKDENGPQVPELVRRIALASCKHDPPAQIVPVIERMAAEKIAIGDLILDSGYSYRQAETCAMPMRALGASLVMDLHPNDRGMKGTHQGAVIANGNLYCPATPKALLELSPPAPGATQQQLAAHDQKTQELSRYKLSTLSAPDSDGYSRAICPAVRGKLRCPLRAESMSLSHQRPTVLEAPEHPPLCCSQQTITVPAAVNAKSTQKHDYPSRAHRLSYSRRTTAERSFSQVFDPAGNDIKRRWSRLMGLTPNAIMLACVFTIANIRSADAFAAHQAEDERRAARGLPPKRRRRRRASAHDPIAQPNAPPAITA